MAALRAFLIHDADGMMPQTFQLGDAAMPGYLSLAHAALSLAARRRFAPRFTSGDLVRYVAAVRVARLADGDEFDVDPQVTEGVLRRALGVEGTTPRLDLEPRFRAVIALLGALAESELPSEAEVDELLAEARVLADRRAATDQMRSSGSGHA